MIFRNQRGEVKGIDIHASEASIILRGDISGCNS